MLMHTHLSGGVMEAVPVDSEFPITEKCIGEVTYFDDTVEWIY